VPDPLLTTKLRIPGVRPELVPRPHLLRRLDEGLRAGHRLALVSAPAGFGKSTLLSTWVRDCGRPAAWLSLDEGDDDPVCFLTYLVAALQQVDDNAGKSVLGALQVPQLPPLKSVVAALANEIAAIPHPFVLVLDDYHTIKAQPVHSAVALLLGHPLPRFHLAIATRADPPLPIARLRASGRLTELRLADLRFTLEEVTEFLNTGMGLKLGSDDIATLASRTEGWIAGLQMAALAVRSHETLHAPSPQPSGSIQARGSISDFIRAFSGSDRYVMDYLVEEVLQHQSKAVQDFVLQTSILDRLCGPLCDAVTGSPEGSGQVTLESLERVNLFITPLDNERRWYRYHQLFADLLRQRLEQHRASDTLSSAGDAGESRSELHVRASEWYERNGYAEAAIEHALSARDFERAADLIESTAEASMMRSQITRFLGWVEQLPDELIRARPTLCLFHAWALLLGSRSLKAVEWRLQTASASIAPVRAAPLHALIATLQGRLDHATELCQHALAELPEGDVFLRDVAA
jgi:LuxR family maltose regulon positive regulatory protein